jgi:hypothetical protein
MPAFRPSGTFAKRAASAMSAQDFHGLSIGGTVQAPTIVNHSDKPIIGYAVQRVTTTGLNALVSVVNFHSLAVGKAIQPGEEHPLGRFNVVRTASQTVGTPLGYELRAFRRWRVPRT